MKKAIWLTFAFLIITIQPAIGGSAPDGTKQAKDLRIAIVGAGASGLTAAYYLKKSGYNNITVYEKEPWVGGKVLSYAYGDHTFELGALWVQDESPVIDELASLYGIDLQPEEVSLMIRDSDSKNYESILGYIAASYDLAEIESALVCFKRIQWKFKSINNIGFAGAEPELFMNADKFIEKYRIEPIAYGFSPLWAGAGYGYYSDVPALYVLKLMVPFVSNLNSSPNVLRRAPEGFQRLWEKVAEDQEDVRLNQTVEKVKRGDNDSSVSIAVTANGLTEIFDRIIISCDLKEALKFLDASQEEQELFSQIQNNDFFVHIFHADSIVYNGGTLVLLGENTVPETIGHITAIINREDTPGVWTSYQIAPLGASSDEVVSLLEEDVRRLGGHVESVIKQKRWNYFPHVKTQTLHDGFYERMEALQGERGTYYIGGIMNFESVENTCEYAEKLVGAYFQD